MISSQEFFAVCRTAAERIEEAIAPLVGTEYGAEELCMGADNTPTERLDRVAEDIVFALFREKKVCRYILSEEAGMVEIGGSAGIAYLDPVDGSFNAGAGIPFYALSVGLSDGKEMIAGYVKNLAADEEFTAEKGKGARLNGEAVRTSCKSDLSVSAISLYARPPEMQRLLQAGYASRRSRLFGASALELCYVACGRLEGFLDLRGTLRITDAAAAILILEEAGGVVSLPDGSPCSFPDDVRCGRSLLGANRLIHEKLTSFMRSI